MKLGCVVMAAGSSSRFGANKLLQEFRGKPLSSWALEAVPQGLFARVCVVTGYETVAETAAQHGFFVVRNDRPELGVSYTIRLGLAQLADCDAVVFMTADQPLLTSETLRRLTAAYVGVPIIAAAAHGGKRGNPCLFSGELFPELMALEGDTGGSRVIKAHPELLQRVEVPAEELLDCDTPEVLYILEKTRQSN